MIKLVTKSQKRVLDAYNEFIDKYNRTPTYREIGDILRISPSSIHLHVKNLEEKWLIERYGRNISMTQDTLRIPLFWTVACGKPISVSETFDNFIELPKSQYKYGQFYALTAIGDSMINAGIRSWDILIIRQQTDVDDGDIAVVVLWEYEDDERATLKRVYKSPKSMLLKPENDAFEPIIVTSSAQIRGKLVSVIRNY